MSDADFDVDDRLEDHPPAAKLVYKILEYEGPELTQQEIADHTLLPGVTVRDALHRLEDADLVEYEYVLEDTRRKVYSPVK